MPLRERLRGAVREPLVHFALAAIVLFAIDAARRAPTDDQVIVIDDGRRAELAAGFERVRGRPPTADELEAEAREWVDLEILHREALAMGLDRDDPIIRRRVVDKLVFLLRTRQAAAEPDDATLRAFFERDPGRWATDPVVDFVHVFVQGGSPDARARAEELRLVLDGGASPDGLGDRFARGRKFHRRRRADLEPGFGAAFASEVLAAPLEAWIVIGSDHGWHVVRVATREPGGQPAFEAARERVLADWKQEREREAVEAALGELRARYEVRGLAP